MDLNDIIGCLLIFICFHLLIGIIIGVAIQEQYGISDDKAIFIAFFWSLIILYFICVYIIKFLGLAFMTFMTLFTWPFKKIKQYIKLKETNKIEEDRYKKETVNEVLKELNLR